MTTDGAAAGPMVVPDIECVVRLTWWPQDFDGEGNLRPEAFRRDDLSGKPGHGVSVDRKTLLEEANVRARAEAQRPKKPEHRVTPHLSSAKVVRIHKETETIKLEGSTDKEVVQQMFMVMVWPLEDNPAHAHIASRRVRTNSQINEARLKLIRFFESPKTFDNYFAQN